MPTTLCLSIFFSVQTKSIKNSRLQVYRYTCYFLKSNTDFQAQTNPYVSVSLCYACSLHLITPGEATEVLKLQQMLQMRMFHFNIYYILQTKNKNVIPLFHRHTAGAGTGAASGKSFNFVGTGPPEHWFNSKTNTNPTYFW